MNFHQSVALGTAALHTSAPVRIRVEHRMLRTLSAPSHAANLEHSLYLMTGVEALETLPFKASSIETLFALSTIPITLSSRLRAFT